MISQSRTLFISPQFIKDNTVVNDSVDTNLVQVSIRTAMDKYIHPLIGSELYEALISKINDGSITGTTNSDYKDLLDNYVIPTLVEYTVYELVPFINYKFRNKSISTQNSPDSTAAGLAELSYLRDNILSTSQFYGERLVAYLRKSASQSLYPEYFTWTQGDIQPAKGDYFGGIFVPKTNRGDCGNFGMGYGIPVNY